MNIRFAGSKSRISWPLPIASAKSMNRPFKFMLVQSVMAVTCLTILLVLGTLRTTTPVRALPLAQADPGSFVEQVVLLGNEARAADGQPPLHANPQLAAAAQAHAEAMAAGDFFDHQNPATGSVPGDRATAAGYTWVAVAENIAAGATTPAAVVQGWLESEGHRRNLLNPDYTEIGVGYFFEADDNFPADGAYNHYWVQLFGRRADYFPLVIANDAPAVTSPDVQLYVYGAEWAQALRLRNDDAPFGDWLPFQSELAWTLPATAGLHTVAVELRDATLTSSATDEVLLAAEAVTAPTLAAPSSASALAAVVTSTLETLPPVPESLAVRTSLEPATIMRGEEAVVDVTLVGQENAQCIGSPGQPVDAIFLFDVSSSAGNGAEGSNWFDTVEFSKELFGSLAQPVYADLRTPPAASNVAMISTIVATTGTVASVLLDLTPDIAQAAQLLDTISPTGDTDIANGLRIASERLATVDPAHRPAIFLMLHDNVPLGGAAVPAAAAVRAQGIPIYLVSNSHNIAPENQITAELAEQITGEATHFLADPAPDDLRRLFVQASGGDLAAAARKVLVRASLDPSDGIDLVRAENGGVFRDNEAIWELDRLQRGEEINLRYTVRAHDSAPLVARSLQLGVAYLDCNGYIQNARLLEDAPLEPAPDTHLTVIEAATPTPTPTSPPVVAAPTLASPAPIILTPAPGATAPPPAPLTRQVISQTLCPGDALTFALPVSLPSKPPKADILLAFDISSSMDDVLASAAANGARLANELQTLLPDVQIGVAIFNDYPLAGGAPGDTPYELLQPITSDQAAQEAILATLPGRLQNGGDIPEAYTRMLYEAAEDSTIGWRTDARHFLIIFGDTLGREVDPGRDGQAGTADDLYLEDVLRQMAAAEVVPLVAASSDAGEAYWQETVAGIGGQVVALANAAQLNDVIMDLITRSTARIQRLAVEISPGYDAWLPNGPVELSNIDVSAGLTQTVDAVVGVPVDVYADLYSFDLTVVGDGALLARWTLQIRVPSSCAPPPPPPPDPPAPFPCDSWLWLWLLPLLLPLLILLLWWLFQLLVNRRRSGASPPSWRCRLPCLLALLLLLALGFVFGQRLARTACLWLQTEPTVPIATSDVGADGSQRVAALILSGDFDFGAAASTLTIEPITLEQLNTATLEQYDTLLISQVCNLNDQPAVRRRALINWVRAGNKLIIYDSDDCSDVVDYSWLSYPFVTDNPGALGSTSGTITVVADHSLVSNNPAAASFIDPADFDGIEIGDANIMLTQNPWWCGDIEAVNANGATGFVHAFALDGQGLVIYNGLDVDNIRAAGPAKLLQQELAQPWTSRSGEAVGLRCDQRVSGVVDLFAPIILFGVPIPWWLPLLLALLLALLCYFACRTYVTPTVFENVQQPVGARQKYTPPPEPLANWDGPPPVWSPEKTLIIGLGGTGRWVLTLIKKNLFDAGAGKISPNVRLLLIDNNVVERIDEAEVDVQFAGVALDESEIMALGADLNDLIRTMARDARQNPEMSSWFPAADFAQRREIELDLRKGAGGERPLGRLALFNDVRHTDGSRLWRALRDGIGAIQENDQARIMLVGSLGGGFGSGILADVAYLARRAAHGVAARFASIEAYLACQHTFDAVVSLQGQRALAANTFAALQELRRLQLQGQSFPARIRYSGQHPGDPVWDGALDRPLLDDLYLFDGYRPQQSLLREVPAHGVYATMADAATLHLDRASRAGANSLWNYRRTVQGQSSNAQQETGQAVISTVGAFTYRLPVHDLNEALKVRWARHLVGLLLLGKAGGALRLDPELNQEERPQAINGLVRNFVNGAPEFGAPSPAVRVLGQLTDRAAYAPQSWAATAQAQTLQDFDTEERLYREYLLDALLLLLNGRSGNLLIDRSGKLGYALLWLERVEREWRNAAEQTEILPGLLGNKSPANLQQWQQVAQRFAAATAAVRSHLQETCVLLSSDLEQAGRDRSARTSTRNATVAVYDQLEAREDQLAARREEMALIITRHYFMSNELLDHWYDEYLADQVEPHLGRLYWQATPDRQGVDLVFNGLGAPSELRGDGVMTIVAALFEMAAYLAQDIWNRETLATYLTDANLREDQVAATADEMWAASAPLLDFDRGGAPEMMAQAVLGVNESVRDTRSLLRLFEQKLPTARQLRQLAITDPYTMLLARFFDVIPVNATTPYRDAEPVYQGLAGLLPEARQSGYAPPPRVVFPAERNALHYARRLSEINESVRIFHPLFVTALEDEAKAILFVQALAGGLVRATYVGDREVLAVETTGATHPLVKEGDEAYRAISPTLIAMLNFVAADATVLNRVRDRLAEMPDLAERWQSYVAERLPALRQSQRPGDRDVAAFVDLVLFDLIQGRRRA